MSIASGPRSAARRVEIAKANLAARFARDERGQIIMFLSFLMAAVCLLGGGVIDFGRFALARAQTLAAMDAAVLAGGRALQSGFGEEEALALARNVYAANARRRLPILEDRITFRVVEGTSVQATGHAEIATPFLSFIEIDKLALVGATDAVAATFAQDRFSGSERELVLVLDTAPACSACANHEALQRAATAFATTLLRNNGTDELKARVALVPFAGDVRPPAEWLSALTDPAASPWRLVSKPGGALRFFKSDCVGERTGAESLTNALPGPGAFLMAAYDRTLAFQQYCRSAPTSVVLPLSDDPAAVSAHIDALAPGTGRAGHVGLAWAYYLLSDTLNALLPASARAQPYGADRLRKVVVLVSTGPFDSERDVQGIARDAGAFVPANGAGAAQQALAMCGRMKAAGIEIFTVGFELQDLSALSTLSACASDLMHFYKAADAASLNTAFHDIALKLTELYLSH